MEIFMAKDLEYYRGKIDSIDTKLIELMEARMDVAKSIGEIKLRSGAAVLDEKRERQVLASRMEKVVNAEYTETIEEFFKDVIALSRQLQQRIIDSHEMKESLSGRAAYQGVDGGYGSIAAAKIFGENIYNVRTFEDVFEEVTNGRADYGVVPFENSTTGSITDVVDMMTKYDLYIVGETSVRVEHCLLGLPGTEISDITDVYSHEQGFFQCKDFLRGKPWSLNAVLNTAVGAKTVAEGGDKSKAAIASERAARLYGLDILSRGINSGQENATRFIIIAKEPVTGDKCTKAAISFGVPHVSGALVNALEILAKYSVNIVKIESRPVIDRIGTYLFFAELEGNITDESMRAAIEELKKYSTEYKYLGSFKKI